MRKINYILLFVLISTIGFSQSTLDKFEDYDDVKSVVVTKKMFELMSKVKVDAKDKEMQQYLSLLKKLDNLKVFSTTNSKIGTEMKTAVSSYLKSNPLEELMRVNEDGKNVKIYIATVGESTLVKELLMHIEGSSKEVPHVVLSLTGEFNLNEITSLTDRMNLPGKNELEKASK